MRKEEFLKYTSFDEKELSLGDRIKLSKLTKKDPETMTMILFNKQPNFLREYEKVYFAKYLSRNCVFYEKEDYVYVAPSSAEKKDLNVFFIPEDSERKTGRKFAEDEGIEYDNVRYYSIIPGARYVMHRKSLEGYPSFDKPWEKGTPFTPKNITIPKTPYAALALTDAKFNVMDDAMICHEAHIKRTEMYEKSYALAKSLKQKGIRKGDFVCLSMDDTIEASIVEAACSFIGAVSVNIPSNASREGIKDFLNRFNCKYYFISDKYRKDAEAAAAEIGNIDMCICSSNMSFKNSENLCKETIDWLNRCSDNRELLPNQTTLEEFMKYGQSYNGNVMEELNPDDPAKILFTSGTSGPPKPILLSNGNINAELIRMSNYTHMKLGPKGNVLKIVADMYPYGDLVSKWLPIYIGKTVCLTPALNANNADFYIYFYEPTYVFGIPDFYRELKKYDSIKEKGLKFFKYLISGGAKYKTSEKEEDNKFLESVGCNKKILDGAGAGEIAAGATAHTELKYNIESVGKPLVGMNVKIIEDNDFIPIEERKELKYNESGLICWGGETLMLEYYGMPEKTAESIYTDEYGRRWFVSDAIGHLDENGSLYITSRKARCFTAVDEETGKAYKLSPEEVESVLADSQFKGECVALRMTIKEDNGTSNNVVKLYVKTEDGSELTEEQKEEILNYFKNSKLAKCSIPRKIVQWNDEWPRLNGEGSKINYRLLQEISDEEEKENNKVMA